MAIFYYLVILSRKNKKGFCFSFIVALIIHGGEQEFEKIYVGKTPNMVSRW